MASALLVASASLAQAQQKPPAGQPTKPGQTQAAPQAQDNPQLVYTPWTKQCGKPQEAGAKAGCLTVRGAFAENGFPMSSVTLIEPEGDKKVLRITVPEPVALAPGMRLVIDQGQPIPIAYLTCFRGACLAEIEATADTITKMKTGQNIFVQAVALSNQVVSLPIPLADFKKVNEGPPIDPKVAEEQAKKFQEDMQKRAEEARKKFEAQQQQSQAPK
jgi:invasion protein IalB